MKDKLITTSVSKIRLVTGIFYACLMALLLASTAARANSITVSGKVTDLTGAGLAGVTVTVTANGNCASYSQQVTSGPDGSYTTTINGVVSLCSIFTLANYTVTASAAKPNYGFGGGAAYSLTSFVNPAANFTINLSETSGPPIFISASAIKIDVNSATLQAVCNPGNQATSAYFSFTDGAPPYQTTTYPLPLLPASTQNQTISQALGNLAAGATYLFSVMANNASGGITTPEQSFTTAPPLIQFYPFRLVLGPLAGSTNVQMTVTPYGFWAATNTTSWLHLPVLSGFSQSNNFALIFDENTGTAPRTGTIHVGNATLTVTQNPGTFTLGTTSLTESPAGGTDSVAMGTSPAGWAWTAAANDPWLHLNTTSGNGSTNVIFTFDPNSGPTRTGTLTLAGQTVTVTQAGTGYVAAGLVDIINNGPAITAGGLYLPSGLAVDAAGNVYIADTWNNAVKEWNAVTGAVILLVSNGLNLPQDVAVDAAGNVYIADTENYQAVLWLQFSHDNYTVVPAGAGGMFYQMTAVTLGGDGNVYLAGTFGSSGAILQYNPVTGMTAPVVTSGLGVPMGVGLDVAGNIYITDRQSGNLLEWNAVGGNLVTLAASGLSTPYGLAVDGGGNVFIADEGHSAIKEWNAASGSLVTVLVGAYNNPASPVQSPLGVAVDAQGNLYVADTFAQAIKELPRAYVDPSPRMETNTPGSDSLPAVVPATFNFTAATLPVSDQPWLTIAGVSGGVVSYNFSANDSGSNRTAHIRLLGQSIAIFQPPILYTLGTTNLVEAPSAGADSVVLAVAPANSPWSATANAGWLHASTASGNGSANVIFTFDPNSGPTRTGTLTIAGQTVTVSQAGAGYAAAGVSSKLFSSAYVNFLLGVATAPSGNVYMANAIPGTLLDWNENTLSVSTLHLPSFYSSLSPVAVAADLSGNLFVSSGLQVYEWNPATGQTNASNFGFSADGLAVDPNGNVFISVFYPGAVYELTPGRTTPARLASTTDYGYNFTPNGLATDRAGNLYFNNAANGRLYERNADTGLITLLTTNLSYSPSGAAGGGGVLAVDGSGNVYAIDVEDGVVQAWQPATGGVTTMLDTGLYGPQGLGVDGSGNVFVADSDNFAFKEIPRVFISTNAVVEPAGSGVDALPPALPAGFTLTGPFQPSSDQVWLTITGDVNGAVTFAFSANPDPTSRSANISLLGQTIPVTQAGMTATPTPPLLTGATLLPDGSLQFSFTNNPAATFTVLGTTNLALPLANWPVVGVATNVGGGVFQFTTPVPAGSANYFYTVRSP